MDNFVLRKLKHAPYVIWVLVAIIVLGIFLRTYHFHDWLRFSMDQSRDAGLISGVLSGKNPWPLLGPLAGGTFFHLGPVYYYFSIFSAKIFGNYPDKMAYPILFFSILTIPLLFLFLREYFDQKISLLLIVLFSVSYFSILSGRFSSNPNLAPFFVLLFLWSILRMLNFGDKINWVWPALAGLALGIGVQIHTTLLVIEPVFAVLTFLYFLKINKLASVKYFIVIFLLALAVNTPQIISEYKTAGANTSRFFLAFGDKGSKGTDLIENVVTTLGCQARANAYFVASSAVNEKCSDKIDLNLKNGSRQLYGNLKNGFFRKTLFIGNIAFLFIFFILGYFLLGYYLKNEKKDAPRNFLGVIGAFNFVSFIFLFPVIGSLSVSYFIILLFIPFVLLGLVFKFFEEKLAVSGKLAVAASAAVLMLFSLSADVRAAAYNFSGQDNNVDNSDLGEIENLTSFILQNSNGKELVILSGRKAYLERFSSPLIYLSGRHGIQLTPLDINDVKNVESEDTFIFVQKSEDGEVSRNKAIYGYSVKSGQKFRNIEIYALWKN